MRGRNRSSANRVTPVTFAVASTLRWGFPTTRNPVGFLPDAIQGLRRRLRVLAAQAGGRQLDGFVDLDVTGAAAEVARERLFDLVARRTRARREECLGGEERSEEHTSELQSQSNLVCRLLLEKKKKEITQ